MIVFNRITMRRGFAPIIIVAIVAAFFIGIGATVAYFKFQSKPLPSPQPSPNSPSAAQTPIPNSPAPGETANWKTYDNHQFSYSIKYPPDWELYADNVRVDLHPKPENGTGLLLTIEKENDFKSTEDFVEGLESQKLNLDGESAYMIKDFEGPEIFANRTVIAIHRGLRFRFYFFVYPRDAESTLFSTFDQILSTFQFTN